MKLKYIEFIDFGVYEYVKVSNGEQVFEYTDDGALWDYTTWALDTIYMLKPRPCRGMNSCIRPGSTIRTEFTNYDGSTQTFDRVMVTIHFDRFDTPCFVFQIPDTEFGGWMRISEDEYKLEYQPIVDTYLHDNIIWGFDKAMTFLDQLPENIMGDLGVDDIRKLGDITPLIPWLCVVSPATEGSLVILDRVMSDVSREYIRPFIENVIEKHKCDMILIADNVEELDFKSSVSVISSGHKWTNRYNTDDEKKNRQRFEDTMYEVAKGYHTYDKNN